MRSEPVTTVPIRAVEALARMARPVTGAAEDYDGVLGMVGDRRLVLIGEASHGTHEFYRERARITRRLIDELGFTVVAVEGDWPDAYRVNRYVMGMGGDTSADEALQGFRRFPTWMWRNRDVLSFVQWLRARNDAQAHPATKVRFYGLDLYSLRASIEAVIDYLERLDPAAAERARLRYSCFDHVGAEGQAYGYALATGAADPCERQVVDQLLELRRQREYRADVSSWNLRDGHMSRTLDALIGHLDRRARGTGTKVVVWAHNSHVGDARATDMGTRGELNIGQLVRQGHSGEVLLIGFSTYAGRVTAASDWGGPTERKHVRPGRADSYEAMLHSVDIPRYWLPTGSLATEDSLSRARLERAIGVIYRPRTELQSHYFQADLTRQFDVMVHLDHTRAVEPLERTPLWDRGEPPETYPTGL